MSLKKLRVLVASKKVYIIRASELAQSEQLSEDLMKLTVDIVKQRTKWDSVEKGCPFTLY
jgi:hypothetical protein